jgi:hypothetical protein
MRAEMAGVLRIVAPAAALAALAAAAPAGAQEVRAGSVYARVTPTQVVLGNSLAERRWDRAPFRTTALVDRRGDERD